MRILILLFVALTVAAVYSRTGLAELRTAAHQIEFAATGGDR